jgi:glucuronoarabinoxylan endo-1,4-beta-xylanase
MHKRVRLRTTIIALTVLAAILPAASQVVLSIDATTEHQTIEGFGAAGGMDVTWGTHPLYTQQFLNDVVDDLGLTIIRTGVDEGTVWDTKVAGYVAAIKAKADQSGEPLRFIGTCWSPPARFKDNNSTVNGGHVIPSMYGQLADYFVGVVNDYRTDAGVELYALSFCNEPRFAQSYNSCLWTETEFRDFVKLLGARFAEAGFATKIFGPEDMLHTFGSYVGAINQDPQAKQYVHAISVHGYVDGVNPASGISSWSQLGRANTVGGYATWQTEISGYTNEWASAFGYLQNFAHGMRYGNVSAWVWWQLSEGADNQYQLMPNFGGKGKKYYGSKHFYRFVRPGAVRIGLDDSQDEAIIAQAYNHKEQRTLTVIMLNTGDSPKQVTLSANSLPGQFTKYTTSSTKNCQNEGVVSSTVSVSIDPMSIVTLHGQSYVTGTSPPAFRRRPCMPGHQQHGTAFSLRGRTLQRGETAAGVYVLMSAGSRGMTRISTDKNR